MWICSTFLCSLVLSLKTVTLSRLLVVCSASFVAYFWQEFSLFSLCTLPPAQSIIGSHNRNAHVCMPHCVQLCVCDCVFSPLTALHLFVFPLQLGGCGILGVGVWLSVTQGNFATLSSSLPSLSAANLLIAVGTIIMVIGCLGCVGAVKESRPLLLTVSHLPGWFLMLWLTRDVITLHSCFTFCCFWHIKNIAQVIHPDILIQLEFLLWSRLIIDSYDMLEIQTMCRINLFEQILYRKWLEQLLFGWVSQRTVSCKQDLSFSISGLFVTNRRRAAFIMRLINRL